MKEKEKQENPRLWESDAARFRYAMDMLTYEIPKLNYSKIKELSKNLYVSLYMALGRPMSEESARMIESTLLPPINALNISLEGDAAKLIYGDWNGETKRKYYTQNVRRFGRLLNAFELIQPKGAMSIQDIQHKFDALSGRLSDNVERNVHCDTILKFSTTLYTQISEHTRGNPALQKALYTIFIKTVDALRQLKNEEDGKAQKTILATARDQFTKMSTIELIKEFEPDAKNEIVEGMLKPHKGGGVAGRPTEEEKAIKRARKKKYLEFLSDGDSVPLKDIKQQFSDVPHKTIDSDLKGMVTKDKTLTQPRHGIYKLAKEGKKIISTKKKKNKE